MPVSMGLAASACGASRRLKKEFWERRSLASGCPGNPIQMPASSAYPTLALASGEVLARASKDAHREQGRAA